MVRARLVSRSQLGPQLVVDEPRLLHRNLKRLPIPPHPRFAISHGRTVYGDAAMNAIGLLPTFATPRTVLAYG